MTTPKEQEYQRQWKLKNKEYVKEWQKEYYRATAETQKARAKKRYETKRYEILQKNKEYVQRNKDKVAESRTRYWHASRKAREQELRTDITERSKKIHRTSRCMARRRGLDYCLTADMIKDMLTPGTCCVTGIKLDMAATSGPWRPSLDRIDSSLGYTPGNVRIVSWIYNAAKQQYTDDDVMKMAIALASRKGAAT